MATVTQMKPFDHKATQQKVRHPLHLMRKYIRRYVFLEGAALILLFAALLFWLGLAFDFGLYCLNIAPLNIFGVDWILELNDVDPTGGVSSVGIRVLLLGTIVLAVLVLGFTKVVARWFREFNDRALALVLERRFPKELGDRLITAVELHDPKMAAKYGYSQAMVEKTILEGVERLKTLPVAGVFNWRRLYRLWFLVGLSTLGVWILVLMISSGSSFAAMQMARSRGEASRAEQAAEAIEKGLAPPEAVPGKDETEWLDPQRFCWKFYDVGAIWTERNVLMQNSYWPRHAYLEIGRFQPSKENPNEMRVARDDVRPDLQVRAYEWVIADRDRDKAPHGWRALTWRDLADKKLIEPDMLACVKIPADFAYWQVDPEELEPNLVGALFDTSAQERPSGELRKHFQLPSVQRKIQERGAHAELTDWLNWQTWKMDKLFGQVNKLKETRVRIKLREINQGADLAALDEILAKLEELAAAPDMARTLRKLKVPEEIEVSFRGEEKSFAETKPLEAGNKYTISLDQLRDSPKFRLRVRGDDYFTQPKWIALVPAPSPAGISIDKDEPAYIYHRLEGVDQMALRGEKHLTRNMPLSTTGDTNTIEVPLGTRLVIHVKTDRKLRAEKAVFTKDNAILPEGYDHFRGQIVPDADQGGFALVMDNLTRKHEFAIDFFDEDNIRGRRRFKIISLIDSEPQLGNLAIFGLNLRKPKFKAPEKGREGEARDLAELMNSYLITPDAIIPFECSVRDDYGLVRVGYQYKYRVEDIDLVAQAAGKKVAPEGDTVSRRIGLVVSNFQFWPGNPQSYLFGPHYLGWTAQRLEQDLRDTQNFVEGETSAEGFEEMLKRKPAIRAADIKAELTRKRSPGPWEFDFKDDRNERGEVGFDLRVHLRELKAVNVQQFGQTHYSLKIAVQATDNNVETGAPFTIALGQGANQKIHHLRGNTKRNKNGYVSFLVVSENELLSQIALEEEQIFEKLEAAKDKVDAGIVNLSQQQAKVVADENVDMENVLNRMNEIRTSLTTARNSIQDSLQAYRNIKQELTINRVKAERKTKIENTILDPLDFIVNSLPIIPGSGSLPNAEEALAAAHAQVESDVNANQRSDPIVHRKNMGEADRALAKLSNDIRLVLDAMSEGIVEAKLIALLAGVEQRQNKITRIIQDIHRMEVERLIKMQLGIETDKEEPKKEEKKEKKTSQLRGRVLNGLAFHGRLDVEVIGRDYPSMTGVAAVVEQESETERDGAALRKMLQAESRLTREFGDLHRDLVRLQKYLQGGSALEQERAERFGKVLNVWQQKSPEREFGKLIAMAKSAPKTPGSGLEAIFEHAEKIVFDLDRMSAMIDGRATDDHEQCRDRRSVLEDDACDVDEARTVARLTALHKELSDQLDTMAEEIVEKKLIELLRRVEMRQPARPVLQPGGRRGLEELIQKALLGHGK
jgi:hypothetical protein